ncbi:ABC transporter ATP-binding protein [Fluviibacterium sp. DFM31]|uniref:ABC transporter ATP-binding protein n=1 Tax=Meridianimarinicoccus marinus TaxID=3231483 RepID=A0ABV3LAK2_9RHOB
MISVAIENKRIGETQVLGPIALEIAAGETLAVVGPSGVGKTTLLRILAGLDRDFTGRVDAPARRAMVFQEPALLPWRSALDNLTLVAGVNTATARAALGEVGLGGLADRFPGQMSLGQQRRLSLARAFAAAPEVLLMDEPFVSLDAALVDEMLALTERLLAARTIATVFVTHSMAEATRLATRIVRLKGHPAMLDPSPA